MRKVVKKTTLWRCSVCGAEYRKKSDAQKCEGMPVEEQKFRVSDQVTNSMEPRVCSSGGEYRFNGRISKVFGPQPPDEEYWNKWLGGLPKTHVFYYEVTYKCPKCGQKKDATYFGPELEKVK
ncbi:MAG: hypothetical protein HYY55_02295 [Candidatus Niyogibacteria bacterium]|nr:MAG: hypothetical protein HYY55_02295 [Candidatus Niyogibacteria bacterium]